MNLTDAQQRAIYEWLGYKFDTDGTATLQEMFPWLPPLGMDYAFRVCIPKLVKECDVTYRHGRWDMQPWKEAYDFARIAQEDFYAALLQYLGVK